MNRTNELFRPLKKHKSMLDARNKNQKTDLLAKQNLIFNEHSPQKTLNILQKVIFKEGALHAKEDTVMELQASKLPLIEYK